MIKISGLQKLSLLDYPGKAAATVFTFGCNFRCPFCHNASLVLNKESPQFIPAEYVLSFLKKRRGLLDGVCISGGEPLMQQSLKGFIAQVKALGYLVKLDTNGSFPQRLKELADDNLIDYVAMDIKSSPSGYAGVAGISQNILPAINESISFLLQGKVEYEFRTTVVKQFHTKGDFIEIGKWIKGADKYFLQNFVDSGDIIQAGLSGVGKAVLNEFADAARQYLPSVEIRT